MLHIWHLFTITSCLFLCLTCPYLVTECKNHHDEQLNVEQAEVQTNYDNPQHKKFSLTNTEKDILSTQAELLTKQIVIFTLDEAPTSTNFSPYPNDAGIAGFLESILVFDEYPDYPYLNTYRIEEDGTCYFKKEIVKQIIKEVFLPAFQELKECLQMAAYIMDKIKINEHILDDDRYLYIFSVEEVNRLASEGMPFRDAYKKVGLDIEAGKFTHNKKVHHTHEGSIGNLCNDRIENLMQQVVDGFNFSVMEQAEQSLLGR